MTEKLRAGLLAEFGQPMAESFDALSEKGKERFARTLRFLGDDPTAGEFVALKLAELEDENTSLEQRVEQLEIEGCGQCGGCEDFFPLSLLKITDDGVALCADDWDEVLQATADLAEQEA